MHDLTTNTKNAMPAAMRAAIDVRCSARFTLGAPTGNGLVA
jgi:hypothetical protein